MFLKKTASPVGIDCKVEGGVTSWRDSDSLPSLTTPSARNVNVTTSGLDIALSCTTSVCNKISEESKCKEI